MEQYEAVQFERVYHRNLKAIGFITRLDTGDSTSAVVKFNDGEEMEVSLALLEHVTPDTVISLMREKGLSYELAISALKSELLGAGATEKQTNKVVSYAWERGHSSGYEEIINILINLLDIWVE